MSVVVALAALLLAAGLAERRRHEQALRAIPIRIHVNGTRGKSSVTRLIAAGLNGAGIRAVAKTTGSAPRFILPDGQEEELRRRGAANIREQLATVRRAAQLGAQALVVECMAIEPELQRFSERLLLRSQITIITNVRPDHQEVLGASPAKMAQAMLGTVPRRGTLILGEERLLSLFFQAATRRGTSVVAVRPAEEPSEREIALFRYKEHPANVACALAACAQLGVNRQVALQGMWRVTPDPGALTIWHLTIGGKRVRFVNAFAANDPESTAAIFQRLGLKPNSERPLVLVFNARQDRPRRSLQLVELFTSMLAADSYLVIGQLSWGIRRRLVGLQRQGLDIEVLGLAAPEEVVRQIGTRAAEGSTVVGIGNIGGAGGAVVELLRARQA